VLGVAEKSALDINHPRAGDLLTAASEDAWFTYYYWLDDRFAPDFARCVDIHRKPGYDPVELFLNPKLKLPRLRLGWRLLQKKLGFRMLMDVIPLEAALVKGSHGIRPAEQKNYPILIAENGSSLPDSAIAATEVYRHIKEQVLC